MAIKVLRPDWGNLAAAARLFWNGIGIQSRLNQPGVVPIWDSGESAAGPYAVMPWLPGGTLADLLDRQPSLRPNDAIRLACQLARIVRSIHAQGLAHGDVSTQNVLLDAAGSPWLTDFDLGTGPGNGSPNWARPAGSTPYPPPQPGVTAGMARDWRGFGGILGQLCRTVRTAG